VAAYRRTEDLAPSPKGDGQTVPMPGPDRASCSRECVSPVASAAASGTPPGSGLAACNHAQRDRIEPAHRSAGGQRAGRGGSRLPIAQAIRLVHSLTSEELADSPH